jgi:hypothetical protein
MNLKEATSTTFRKIVIISIALLAIVWIGAMLVGNAEAASYQLGVDTVKTVNCTNATQRTDGTALPLTDIAEVAVKITGPSSYTSTVTMVGGCAPVDLLLAGLSAGTYVMTGTTKDTGGRVSASSAPVNFTLLAAIAAPNPPVILP